jgi:cell division protein FtsZ
MGAASRPGKVAPGMYGQWVTSDATKWPRYWMNYNFEAPFYGLGSANHPDLIRPYNAQQVAELPWQRNFTAPAGYAGAMWERTTSPFHQYQPAPAPAPVEDVVHEEPYIPPEPVRSDGRTPRMPRLEDFPPVVQQQAASREPEVPEPNRRLGILRTLASVALGLRETEAPAPEPQAPEPARQEPQFGSASQDFRRPQPSHAGQGLYRPRQGDLDPHGRTQAQRPAHEDDHLEIPAFLRRQSN